MPWIEGRDGDTKQASAQRVLIASGLEPEFRARVESGGGRAMHVHGPRSRCTKVRWKQTC